MFVQRDSRMRRSLRGAFLPWLTLLLAIFPICLPAQGPSPRTRVLHGHIPAAARRLTAIGRLAATNELTLSIGLPVQNREQLDLLLQQLYDPTSPNYRHFLSPQEFIDRFGPTEQDYQAVIEFARTNGLRVAGTHPNRMLLDVTGAAPDIERTFHLNLRTYRHPTERRTFFAPDSEPTIPERVPMLAIGGLNNFEVPHPMNLRMASPSAATNATPLSGSGPSGWYMGRDFRAAYLPGVSLTGAGQAVALLEFDGYRTSDIRTYESVAHLPQVPLQNVLLDSFDGSAGSNNVEVALDIEVASAIAYGLTNVIVYEAGPYGNGDDILSRMATDKLAWQISSSWSFPITTNTDQLFQELAAQGQSFFNASGDSGAYNDANPPPSPCDDAYVTSVGGTTLTMSSTGSNWVSETVWNWYSTRQGTYAGSGGVSESYLLPSWQQGINMTANHGSTAMRNIPDVALTADNILTVANNGQGLDLGGTSCAAPLWAGFMALVNQQAASNHAPNIGFINPAVYTIGKGSLYSSCFHDITTGNNTNPVSPINFHAVTGYDLATGWGTPTGSNLLNALATAFPIVTIPPTNRSAAVGSSVSLSVTPGGLAPFTYRWLKNGTNLVNGGEVSGSTTNVLTLNPVGTNDAGSFSVVISNIVGSVTSTPAILTVGFAPNVTNSPQGLVLVVGSAASFSVTAGGTAPLAYQWQKNGAALADGGEILGSKSNLLSLSAVTTSDTANYSVVITNAFGSVTSAPASLLVGIIPVVTNAPQNEIVASGATTGFSVTAGGSSPLAYHWLKNGAPLADGGEVSGSQTNVLTLTGVTTNDTANYAVAITNIFGSVTSTPASLLVGVAPAISNSPLSLIVTSGTPVGFTVTAGGTTPLGFRWLKNGLALSDGGEISGSASASLMLITTMTNDAGAYAAVVTNIFGSVTSNPASLLVGFAPSISNAPQNLIVVSGGTAAFSTTACGSAPLAYQWLSNGVPLTDGGEVSGSATNLLTLTGVTINDSAGYAIVVTNIFGSVTSTPASLLVGFAPAISNSPSSLIVTNGTPAGFTVIADGTTPLGYRWLKNGLALSDGGEISGTASPSLMLSTTTTNDIGAYAAVVTNIFGSVTSTPASLLVGFAPSISNAPQNLILVSGGTAAFSATACGTAPLAYQWLSNGVPLTDGGEVSGSATNLLTLTGVTINDSAGYAIVVTNIFGSVTSTPASLLVGFAPAISNAPQSVVVGSGGATAFGVIAGGTAPLAYQWLRNGLPLFDGSEISGSATNLLAVNPATAVDVGSYAVIVTNIFGSVTSTPAMLAIGVPPVITNAPLGLITLGGSPATFSVIAGGTAPLAYQWFANGAALSDGGEVSGSSSNILTLSDTVTNDTGGYVVVITNAFGSVTSAPASLLVGFAPAISNAPQSQIVATGGFAAFGVTASGTAPFVYRWLLNGVPLTEGGPISGSATNLLTVSPATTNNIGGYSVVITNIFGSVTSAPASLVVGAAPIITNSPQSIVAVAGSPATFVVGVCGTAPLTYQWLANGAPLSDGGEISGSASNILALSDTTTNDTGGYSVVITNIFGSVTSTPAALLVGLAPAISNAPQSLMLTSGSAAAFGVIAGGTGPLTYEWLLNGTPLADGGSISGSATNLLNVSPATTNNSGAYAVIVTNMFGSVTSAPASLVIGFAPAISNAPLSVVDLSGNPASFTVGACGTPPLTYQWLKNGTPLADGGEISGTATNILAFGNATTNDSGGYVVVITNAFGSVTSAPASLLVGFAPAISNAPQSLVVTNGTPVAFSVSASGTAPLNYQWLKGGVPLFDGGEISGSATNLLAFNPATTNDAGAYAVVITNIFGSVTSTPASLVIGFAPAITNEPQGAVAVSGSAMAFSVGACGTAPLMYQWLKNGAPLTDGGEISGSISNTFALSGVTINDTGSYSVIITNIFGSVTSSPASLVVGFAPAISNAPQSLIITSGSPTAFAVAASGTAPLSYQWLKGGLTLIDGSEISGSGTNLLTINPATTTDAGAYAVIITNIFGNVTSTPASLVVGFAPVVTNTPQSVVAVSGGSVTFNASVSGTSPLIYQWLKNSAPLSDGGEISGTASNVLTLSGITTNDTGGYSLLITNPFGAATGSVATLTVVNVPLTPVAIARNAGGLTLTFNGIPGVNYVLEAATNLHPPVTWQVVATQTAGTNGLWQFTDTGVSNYPSKFYRTTLP